MPLQTVGVQTVIIHASLSLGQKASFPQKENFSDTKYLEVTANVVGTSTTPSKTKGKQPIVSSDESDTGPQGV